MQRRVYCNCDSDFTNHYQSQAGNGFSEIEVFRGQPYQRGYGLGSILKRFGIPILKLLGKELLKTGVNISNDILSHGNVKQAVKIRSKEGVKSAATRSLKHLSDLINQEGSGIRTRKRKKTTKKSRSIKTLRKRPKKSDIFS